MRLRKKQIYVAETNQKNGFIDHMMSPRWRLRDTEVTGCQYDVQVSTLLSNETPKFLTRPWKFDLVISFYLQCNLKRNSWAFEFS